MRKLLAILITALTIFLIWFIAINSDRGQSPSTTVPAAKPAPVAVQPTAGPSTRSPGSEADISALIAKTLTLPVAGVQPADLVDTWGQSRAGGARAHEAIDILAPRGTPVVATENGRIAKLFTSALGGITIYQFDPSETYVYYYAHLDRYAPGLTEGQAVSRGHLIGYVGFTGDAAESAPHLHFAIDRLNAGKKWWQGTPINPYRPLRGN